VWNVQSAGLVTFKLEDGRLRAPYQDVFVELDVPRFLGSASVLQVRRSYTSESTLGYYGLGNASSAVLPAGAPATYFLYGRVHPSVNVDLRWRLVDHVAAHLAARYTQNWLKVADGSRLAQDLESGNAEVKRLLGTTGPDGVALFSYGLQWDDRDSEVSTHRGSLHEALVRLSPGGTDAFPYRHGQANVDSRSFVDLWPGHMVLAVRGVVDVLFGDPPLYELARFDDSHAIGGPQGVRGVPAQRCYGKLKVFGNAEIRTDVASFRALGKAMILGLVGFFDAGRVWADLTPQPQLDGTGVGLKYGVGGGIRLQSGEAFVLRADVAWSPDARPVGAYFAAGQTF
jgi:outer membrane protein assembly factor BamA